MIFSRGAGWVEQPFSPAKASDAPISMRKRRRVIGSVHSDACVGNLPVHHLLELGRVQELLQAAPVAPAGLLDEQAVNRLAWSPFSTPRDPLAGRAATRRLLLTMARRATGQLARSANMVDLSAASHPRAAWSSAFQVMLKTSDFGRSCVSGLRWHCRHHSISSVFSW